jgi:hypothetical protein
LLIILSVFVTEYLTFSSETGGVLREPGSTGLRRQRHGWPHWRPSMGFDEILPFRWL